MSEFLFKSRITRIRELFPTLESWAGAVGADPAEVSRDYRELTEAEDYDLDVTVVAEETDGYYLVQFPSGHEIVGLSGYHLKVLDSQCKMGVNCSYCG